MSNFIKDLSKEKEKIAEEAKKAASEIVQDAIDKRCYGFPVSFHYTCSEPVDPYTFCCIPTKEFLDALLARFDKVRFKEDTDPKKSKAYAYVIPQEKTDIVYLCELFWKAVDTLCKNSKPGIIIHEVSHLLGTVDIFYEHLTIELFENYGTLLGKSKCVKDLNGEEHYREEVFQVNANCLEYEFETIINHKKTYSDGRYQCCGETKKNSVCRERCTGHYYLHERFASQKDEMKRRLETFWQETTARIEGRKIRYVKKEKQACEEIPVTEP